MFRKILILGIFLLLISSVLGYTALDARQGICEAEGRISENDICGLAEFPGRPDLSYQEGDECTIEFKGEWDFEKITNDSGEIVWWGDGDFDDLGDLGGEFDICLYDLELAFCGECQSSGYCSSYYGEPGYSRIYIDYESPSGGEECVWEMTKWYDCDEKGECVYTQDYWGYCDGEDFREDSSGSFDYSLDWKPEACQFMEDTCSLENSEIIETDCDQRSFIRHNMFCAPSFFGGLGEDVLYEIEGRCCEDLDWDSYDNCNTGEDGDDGNILDCDDEDDEVYESVNCYVDGDGDGFGAGSVVALCGSSCSSGYSDNGDDCDDSDPSLTDNCPNCNVNADCDDSDDNTLDACVGGFCQNKAGAIPGLCGESIDFLRAYCEEPETGVPDAVKNPVGSPCNNRGTISGSGDYVVVNSLNLSSEEVEVGDGFNFSINILGNNNVSGARAADIMYVVDKSGSMEGSPITTAVDAVNTLDGFFSDYNSDSGNDAFKVGLTAFNHDPVIESHLKNAGNPVSISSPCGCTGIGGGVNHSIFQDLEDSSLSCTSSDVSKVVVLFSDGMENRQPYLSAVEPNVPSDVTFYSIGVTGIAGLEAILKDVATWGTGEGLYYSIPSMGDLESVYKRIANIYVSDSAASEVIVRVSLNESFDYLGSSIAPFSVSGNNLEWRFTNLSVGELKEIEVNVNITGGHGLTDIFSSKEVIIYNPAGRNVLDFNNLDVMIGSSDPSLCVLTDAYWSMNDAFEGQVVDLIVEGENCEGVGLDFEVFEKELLEDNPSSVNPSSVFFSGGEARTTWVAEGGCDAFSFLGGCKDEVMNYYFIASNGSKLIDSGKDEGDLLNVYPEVDISKSYWANMDNLPIGYAQKKDLVKLVANGSSSFEGKNLRFEIYQDGDVLQEVQGIGQFSDWAFLLWRPPSEGVYKFEVIDEDTGDVVSPMSNDLEISTFEHNSPSKVFFESPDCGYYNFTGINVVVNVSLFDEDDWLNGTIDFGDGFVKLINSSKEKWSVSHEYSGKGSYSIVATVLDGRGNEEGSVTNIMVVQPGVEGKYLAACISKPEDYGDVGQGTVEFDASDTVGLNYTGSGELENALISLKDDNYDDDDAFSFRWEFSDGGENPYINGGEKLSYLFWKEYLTAGRNWANVQVSFGQ